MTQHKVLSISKKKIKNMSLKIELGLIYEQVYMIKESISEIDARALLAGFDDGINEGIGKWLGKTAGWISDIPNKAKKATSIIGSKAKELYGKGKELATKAVEKMKEFTSKAIDGIKQKMSQAGKWISERFESFIEKMKNAFSLIGEKLVEFWEATKEKSAKFWEVTKEFLRRMIEAIQKGYQSTKEGLANMGAGISEWVQKNWERLKEISVNTKDRMSNLYLKAIEAIKKGGQSAKKWIDIVALHLISKPVEKIKEWIKKIPELYEKYSRMFKEFIDIQLREFKLGFEETSGRPWNRSKGFIEKPVYPDVDVAPLKPESEISVSSEDPINNAGTALTSVAAQSEVGDAAYNLVKNISFRKRYMNYSSNDLRSMLKSRKMTPKAIEWIIAFMEEEKEKKMPIPEGFRYIKTFEAFNKK
jgi:hypothetical protein